MTGRRRRALIVAFVAAIAAGLGILAVLNSVRAAGVILAIAVMLLALLLYREIERAAELRERTAAAETALAQTTTHLEQAESIDSMTKLASRYRLFEQLQQEFRRSVRYHHALSFVLLDLDRFTAINEQYGEHFGDTVLTQVASILTHNLRDTDVAARYEGEEFALLLPGTSPGQAVMAAEHLREHLKRHVFSNGVVACSISASFGVSGVPDPRVMRPDDLVRLAAQALAEAKRRGRDRIVADTPPSPPPPLPAADSPSPLSGLTSLSDAALAIQSDESLR
jgi:two-component system, cell cycle response regulator